jgi:HEAT repeat protein
MRLPEPGSTVEQLVALLSSPDKFVRARAARMLVNKGPEAAGELSALLAMHTDPWYMVRVQVPRAAMHLRARPDQVEEILDRLMKDEDSIVRLYSQIAVEEVHGRRSIKLRPH